MRAYTLSILSSLANTNSPIIEKEIVAWVNTKLKEANKTSSLKSFQDSSIADGKVVIDLVDSIKPGSVNYDVVKSSGTEEVTTQFAFTKKKKLGNMLKAISICSCFVGQHRQCQVRHFDGPQNRCTCVRPARRHHRSQTENGDDRLRLSHGNGLHTQHGFSTKPKQCECNRSGITMNRFIRVWNYTTNLRFVFVFFFSRASRQDTQKSLIE